MTPYARPGDRLRFIGEPDGLWHSRCSGCGPSFQLAFIRKPLERVA